MKKLIDYLSEKEKIPNKELLEKDIVLHGLLCELERNSYFKENFVFKGGTCLAKCYYRYYRFSEDLDFTWIKQDLFEYKNQKQIRKILSVEIDKIMKILGGCSKTLNLEFEENKSNKKFVELGGSNKFATFKLWYKSEISTAEKFIKMQISYVELLKYPFKVLKAKTIISKADIKEIRFLFPEESKYFFEHPNVTCYDIKEILLEKTRAILTRRGIKAKDFIDLLEITSKEKINLEELEKEIIEKTKFMLHYDKYIQNLKDYRLEKLVLGEEEKLLLIPTSKDFEKFVKETKPFLERITKKLQNNT